MEITASMVKELRDQTDAPMLDCKRALVQCDGHMERARELLSLPLHFRSLWQPEETMKLRQQRDEFQREREIDEQRIADLMADLGRVAKQRDELIAALKQTLFALAETRDKRFPETIKEALAAIAKCKEES